MSYLPEELFDEIVLFLTPHLRLRDDREGILIPILNLWEGYGSIEWEGQPRAFTTRLVEKLPLDLLKSVIRRMPVGVDQKQLAESLCVRIDEPRAAPSHQLDYSHELHRYPRGPMVEAFRVNMSIKAAYAAYVDPTEAHAIVGEANAFRLESDPDDSSVTLIKLGNLPPPLGVRPRAYWEAAFGEACLHGPRMLAALLLVVPDDLFPENAKTARAKLLQYLPNHK